MYVINVKFIFNSYETSWVLDEGDVMDTMRFLETSEQVEHYSVNQIGTTYLDVRNEFALDMANYPKLNQ